MSDLILEATTAARTHGGRMTAQRRLVMETLQSLGGHPTAEDVYHAARQRHASIHPSTVYRTLDWLEAAGLVDHRHLDAGVRRERCERFDPTTAVEHHHFICSACGRVIEFQARAVEAIKTEFAVQYSAAVEHAALTLYGMCAACRRAGLDV